jgi:hypothetical protein
VRATYPDHFITEEAHVAWQQKEPLISAMRMLSEAINRKGSGASPKNEAKIPPATRRQTFAAPVSCAVACAGAGGSSGGASSTEYVRVGLSLIRQHWSRPAVLRVLVDLLYEMVTSPAQPAGGGIGGEGVHGDTVKSHATDFEFFWPQYLHLLLVPDLHTDSEQVLQLPTTTAPHIVLAWKREERGKERREESGERREERGERRERRGVEGQYEVNSSYSTNSTLDIRYVH